MFIEGRRGRYKPAAMDSSRQQRAAEQKAPRSGRALAIAALVALLVVLAVYLVGAAAARRYEGFLSGYWVGDPGFLQKARLRDMQFYVAPPEGGARQGYLLMTDLDGNFVANRAVELRVRPPFPRWWAALGAAFRAERDAYAAGHLEIEFDGPAEPPMPERVKLTVSMLDGTLTLYDDTAVYGFLTKDYAASAAAAEAYAAGGPQ